MTTINFKMSKDKSNEKGTCPIYSQFFIEGKRQVQDTGIRLHPQFWNDVAQHAIGPGSEEINHQLKKLIENHYGNS